MAEYKDIAPLKKQIADIKKAMHSQNSDYLTGYLCALSVTEGVIAGLPAADVVEVVRCKDCKYWKQVTAERHACCMIGFEMDYDEYCSYGERKEK